MQKLIARDSAYVLDMRDGKQDVYFACVAFPVTASSRAVKSTTCKPACPVKTPLDANRERAARRRSWITITRLWPQQIATMSRA